MYNQEYAFVNPNKNPNPLELFMQLKQYNDEQKRYQDQIARQQREYHDKLLMYAADKLDPKYFGTGTNYDPVIDHNLNTLYSSAAKMISENPDANLSNVQMFIGKGVNDISQLSDKIKNIRANVEAASKQFANNPSIDANKLLKLSLTNALMKYNPQRHSFDLKDPSEIDDQHDYVADTLDRNGDDVITGNKYFIDYLHNIPGTKTGDTIKRRDKMGNEVDSMYSGELKPFQTLAKNENGKMVAVPRTQEITLGNNQKDNVLSDDAYSLVFGDKTNSVLLNNAYKGFIKQNGLDENSLNPTQANYIKRKVAQKMIDGVGMNGIVNSDIQKERPMPIRLIYPGANDVNGNKDNTFEILGKIASGQLNYGTPGQDGFVEIGNYLPHAVLNDGRIIKTEAGSNSYDAYNKVEYNPTTKTFRTVDVKYKRKPDGSVQLDEYGKPMTEPISREIKPTEISDWIKSIARSNGNLSPEAAYNEFSKYYKPPTKLNVSPDVDSDLNNFIDKKRNKSSVLNSATNAIKNAFGIGTKVKD